MRRTGTKWHAFWNELHTKEKAAKGKSGSSSFEYRLLCGCYAKRQDIDEELAREPLKAGPTPEDVVEVKVVETPAVETPVVAAAPACEVKCTDGKACGDECISSLSTCSTPPGKACDVEAKELQLMDQAAEEAITRNEVHTAMVAALGETEVSACGVHEIALARARCICSTANHYVDDQAAADKQITGSTKQMGRECNERTSDARRWAAPFTCITQSKKKGGRKSKERLKWCQESGVSWSSTSSSDPGAEGRTPMTMDLGSIFRY